MIKLIITHDRVFHADETFAAAMLRILYPQAEILRTRDQVKIRREAGASDVAILDVGGRYDPSQNLFDHHQQEGAGYRDSCHRLWPYATAGLVWRHYGEAVVKKLHPKLQDSGVREVAEFLDDSFVRFIDAIDCGERVPSAGPNISGLIASFNPAWFEETSENDTFTLVLELATVCLQNLIKRHAGKVLARDLVRQAESVMNGKVLVLDRCLPWSGVVSEEMPDVLLVVYPTSQDQWQVRVATDGPMTPRIMLPAAWAGLEGAALTSRSGVDESLFCHRSLHLAGARSKNAVLELAKAAMTQAKQALAA